MALIITLGLLVLVAVAVTAFMTRTTTNQQITASSTSGVVTQIYADGATQETIAGLQKEMWDLSGYSQLNPAPTPAIFPIMPLPNGVANRIQGIVPTIMVGPGVPAFPADGTTPLDPNAGYSQFANLVKQSYTGVATYKGVSGSGAGTTLAAGPQVNGPMNASNVPTTLASADGRLQEGSFWNQPQLTSIAAADTKDLGYLVPDWIYTSRDGSHPKTYASTLLPSNNGTLTSTSVVGRYAYNIYDIGGLLNANVAGYGGGVNKDPTSTSTMIVPGYKGSVLMADLSGLNMGGALTVNGASGTTFANPGAPNSLPNFRYLQGQQNWATDLPTLLASGQYGGWLQPFLPKLDPAVPGAAPSGTPSRLSYLTNNNFTSRQDLITWVNSQLGAGTKSAAWALPYLTHFSYDLDAPTFTPNPMRPRSNVALGTVGGNDSSSANDDRANPAFTAVLDGNGNPLVKRRFPLSALALLEIDPGNVPPDLLDATSKLSLQIQYDFGLVWDKDFNCWDYKDSDGGSGAIKQLPTATNHGVGTVPQNRSPNFFELLKAAITTGSLGKQWGAGSVDQDADNTLGAPRYSATAYQIVQIGANIISQSTTNFCPTAIRLFGPGQAPVIYGAKDLPYFYRSRLLTMTVGDFTGTAMEDIQKPASPTHSVLAAVLVQPELWNPHAPNLLASSANYPKLFRVVPKADAALGLNVYTTGAAKWADGPYHGGITATGDYTSIGGPNCPQILTYDPSKPDAYIQFSSIPPETSPSPLGSFREPCPLAAPNFPPDIHLTGVPLNPTMAIGEKVAWDQKPNTTIVSQYPASKQNTIPVRFSPISSNAALGFLLGYCCGGPSPSLTVMRSPSGGPLSLELQYSIDGIHFYPYDTLPTTYTYGSTITSFTPPSGVQQSWTGVRTDPRTQRWGLIWTKIPYGYYIYGNGTYIPNTTYENQAGLTYSPSTNLGTTNYGSSGNMVSLPKAPGWFGTLSATTPGNVLQMAWTQVNQPNSPGYYEDPDGVVRPADGAYVNVNGSSAGSTIGLPEAMLKMEGNAQGGTPGVTNYDSRPIVLNRPFQSVAELGYAFRGTPWRSLDFFNPESGDAALLDVFTVYGPDPYSYKDTFTTETGLVAGKVNLNTRQQPVLAALLKGAATTTVPGSATPTLATLDDPQAAAIAQALVQWTTDEKASTNATDFYGHPTSNVEGPLLNPAELVGKYTGTGGTASDGYNGFSSTLTKLLTGSEPPVIKQQRECVVHALADSGTTRTWNLLIDLVAQTGQLAQNAAQSKQPLQSFLVNGQQHVWVSVAIDRLTGKVIRMQVEPVRS